AHEADDRPLDGTARTEPLDEEDIETGREKARAGRNDDVCDRLWRYTRSPQGSARRLLREHDALRLVDAHAALRRRERLERRVPRKELEVHGIIAIEIDDDRLSALDPASSIDAVRQVGDAIGCRDGSRALEDAQHEIEHPLLRARMYGKRGADPQKSRSGSSVSIHGWPMTLMDEMASSRREELRATSPHRLSAERRSVSLAPRSTRSPRPRPVPARRADFRDRKPPRPR